RQRITRLAQFPPLVGELEAGRRRDLRFLGKRDLSRGEVAQALVAAPREDGQSARPIVLHEAQVAAHSLGRFGVVRKGRQFVASRGVLEGLPPALANILAQARRFDEEFGGDGSGGWFPFPPAFRGADLFVLLDRLGKRLGEVGSRVSEVVAISGDGPSRG
ncbi:MAG: hypothetical protein ACK56I_01915, partial [bacterium]